MEQEDKVRAEQLASEHWQWFEDVVGHVAKDFFVHGYKHGADDRDNKEVKSETK